MAFSQITLLDYVQRTLNEMHSDQVNTIGSTDESLTVANIARDMYNELYQSSDEYKFTKDILQLYGVGDVNNPTKMTVPEEVAAIAVFSYNATTTEGNYQYQVVEYKDPIEFLGIVQARSTSTGVGVSDIQTVNIKDGITIFVYNDRPPQIYTSFNDSAIYCDAFNSNVEDTLQQQKTQIYANIKQDFQMLDTFIPTLPFNMEELYLNKIKSRCFRVLRGENHEEAEKYVKSMEQRAKYISARTPTQPDIVKWGRGGRYYN